MSTLEEMTVAVIIPSRGRDECLRQTLRDLAKQDYPLLEVWVVDQNEKPLQGLESDLSPVKLVHKTMPPLGSHAGRNLAINQTTADYCVFVDDDVRVAPNFISLHMKSFHEMRQYGFQILAGKVVQPKDRLTAKQMKNNFKPAKYNPYFGIVSGNFIGEMRCDVDHIHECNFSAPTEILREVGGFNENFKGNAYFEGTDLALRIKNKGYHILFCPEVSLIHLQDGKGGNRETNKSKHTYWFLRNLGLLNSKHMRSYGLPLYGIYALSYMFAKTIKNKDLEIAKQGMKGFLDGVKFFYEKPKV